MSDSTTKSATQNLEKLYGQNQGETRQEKPSPLSPEKALLIQKGLEKLLSYGLLTDALAVRDWANGIADMDEDCLREGFKKAKDFTGYMTIGDFRGLCKRPRSHASHSQFKSLGHQSMPKDELKAKIAKMRKETGL